MKKTVEQFSDEEIIQIEHYIAIGQQRALVSNFKSSATLFSLLLQLMDKNENVSLKLGIFRGGCRFPYPVDTQRITKEGSLTATIGLRIGTGEIYWPRSTNAVMVADIQSGEYGINVKIFSLEDESVANLKGDKYNRIIQRCFFTDLPHQLPGLEYQEVKDLHNKAVTDIKDIFKEYIE